MPPDRQLLDRRTEADDQPHQHLLEAIQTEWLASRAPEEGLDWRYYMVKYAAMRTGRSGLFRSKPEGTAGYTLWMLDKENMRGSLCDPFLKALLELSRVGEAAALGYYQLTLKVSELQVRSVPKGFAVKEPVLDAHRSIFGRVRSERGLIDTDTPGEFLLFIPQVELDEGPVGIVDRVQQGAEFLQTLVDAGL